MRVIRYLIRSWIFWGFGLWIVYIYFQSQSIFGGDSGEFVAAASIWGIPHPPGYSLYMMVSGILVRFLHFGTPAWRVSLISSFFAAASICLFYQILKRLVKSNLAATSGALIFSFVYPFFLYAEVPEVFSLSIFFNSLLIFCLLTFEGSRRFLYLILFSFTLGLSFTHHHIVVFLIPTLLLLLWKERSWFLKIFNKKRSILLFLAFLVGLIPLFYFPIASSKFPAIDWEHPANMANFLNLFFRKAYGTFTASTYVDNSIYARFISLQSFLKLFWVDFRNIGVFLFIIGLYSFYKSNRKYFYPFFVGLLAYIFFFFYANFPVGNSFSEATFERFAIFPYFFAVVFITFGIFYISKIIMYIFKYVVVNNDLLKFTATSVSLLFLIYPLSLFYKNSVQIYTLKNDNTAERLGFDILNTVPSQSMLLLIGDTPLFNTQYVYYGLDYKRQEDVTLLHFTRLFFPYYPQTVKRINPKVYLPNKITNEDQYSQEFIAKNSEKYTLMFNFFIPTLKNKLVPYGLLWRYYPSLTPSISQIIDENERLWKKYQYLNPDDIKFRNLFLDDELDIYSTARQNYANFLLEKGDADNALIQLAEAQRLTPKDNDINLLYGKAYRLKGKCQKAENFYLLYKNGEMDNVTIYDDLIDVSKNCFGDKTKTLKYETERNDLIKKILPKLNNL